MLLDAEVRIKLLELCLSTHKGCFMPDSTFVVKLALIIVMRISSADFVAESILGTQI